MGYYEATLTAQKEITKIIRESPTEKPLSRNDLKFFIKSKYPVPKKMCDDWLNELIERGFIEETEEGLIWVKTTSSKKGDSSGLEAKTKRKPKK